MRLSFFLFFFLYFSMILMEQPRRSGLTILILLLSTNWRPSATEREICFETKKFPWRIDADWVFQADILVYFNTNTAVRQLYNLKYRNIGPINQIINKEKRVRSDIKAGKAGRAWRLERYRQSDKCLSCFLQLEMIWLFRKCIFVLVAFLYHWNIAVLILSADKINNNN